jgi:hypothetical protein
MPRLKLVHLFTAAIAHDHDRRVDTPRRLFGLLDPILRIHAGLRLTFNPPVPTARPVRRAPCSRNR